MVRLLGFIVGVLLVAGPVYHLSGYALPVTEKIVPVAAGQTDAVVASPLDTAPIPESIGGDAGPMASTEDAREDLDNDAPETAGASDQAAVPVPEQVLEQAPRQAPGQLPEQPTQSPERAAVAMVAGVDGAVPADTGEPDRRLHMFWSPFRTRNAADGFARRLSRVSGVDVRVARAEPGRYRVGFDYDDAQERNWYLGQIQARTGLDLGAGDVEGRADEDLAGRISVAD